MKKLYTRFFHIPKHEKIGEKVMLTRVATTIATIVVCLIAMSLTAYAYFSCDVTSGSNVIKAAKFDAQITITDESDNRVEPSAKEGKISTFAFTVPGNYTVTLSPKEDNTAQTGFCVVYVGEDTYHTQQIGVDALANNQKRESVSFTLQVKGAETVKIESHWGTSSHYDYTDNDFYIIESNPLKVIVVGTAANSSTDTNEVTTTTTTTTETTTIPETSVAKTTETTTVETTTFPQTTNTTETTVETTNATETTTFVTTAESTTVTTESNITEQTEPTDETTTATAGAPTA